MRRPELRDRRGGTNSHVFFISTPKESLNAELGKLEAMNKNADGSHSFVMRSKPLTSIFNYEKKDFFVALFDNFVILVMRYV